MEWGIIFLARYLIFVSIGLSILILGWQGRTRWREVIKITGIILITAFILSRAAGALYFNPRPFVVGNFTPLVPHAPDNSFPSDHALLAAALAASVGFWQRRWGVLLGLIAVLIGAGRVLAGVHQPLDVVASFAIVIFTAYLTKILFNVRPS